VDALTQIDIDGRDLGLHVVENGGDGVAIATNNDGGSRANRGGCRCEPSEGSGGGEEDSPEGRHCVRSVIERE